MKTLVVGGSGIVGTLVLPILAKTHDLRIFDLRPPQIGNYVQVSTKVSSPSPTVAKLDSAARTNSPAR